jgi:hypothetical protein
LLPLGPHPTLTTLQKNTKVSALEIGTPSPSQYEPAKKRAFNADIPREVWGGQLKKVLPRGRKISFHAR